MDERAVVLAESSLRRSLGSLDGIAVPTLSALRARHRSLPRWRALFAPLVTAAVVLVAALALGQGLALWRAERSSPVAATAAPLVASPEQRYFDVDGYRFTVTIVRDARYGLSPTAGAAYVSAVTGVGVRCEWTRNGPEVAKATEVWGTRENVVSTAPYSAVQNGAQGDRTSGVPRDSLQGGGATMTCGLSDDSGGHGVYIDIGLGATGDFRAGSLSLSRWSGVIGDTVAAVVCKGMVGTATLIAAFNSTAGEIADWVENAAYPNAPQLRNSAFRTSYAPSAPIYVCYFSGSWAPPVAPAGPGQTERAIDYDRARYFIDANGKEVPPRTIGSSGPSGYLPFVRPGGRF